MTNWRTIQFFIFHFGVCEVQIDVDDSDNIRCDCPLWSSRRGCHHSKWVRTKMNMNSGHYPLQLSSKKINEEEIQRAIKSQQKFRKFVLQNTRIEVLD